MARGCYNSQSLNDRYNPSRQINRSKSLSRGSTIECPNIAVSGGNPYLKLTVNPIDSAPAHTPRSSKLPRRQESLTVPREAFDDYPMTAYSSCGNPVQQSPQFGSIRKTSSFCSHTDFYQHALMVSFLEKQVSKIFA